MINLRPIPYCVWKCPVEPPPQASFAKVHQEGNSVGKIGFHFEGHRPVIDEGILARKTRTVEQHFIAPIYRFISSKCRTADIDKEDLSRIGEEVVIKPTLCRELRRRYAMLLIRLYRCRYSPPNTHLLPPLV